MNEIAALLSNLRRISPVDWVGPAIVALNSPGMHFAGGSSNDGRASANELAKIYERRLIHCREHNVKCTGIESLLNGLRDVPESTKIKVDPFLGETHAITVFYDASGRILSCVTVDGYDPERGARNLAFAIGKQ